MMKKGSIWDLYRKATETDKLETIISTIWHTGGSSLQKESPDALWMHVCPDAVKLNRKGHPVITTYRDPKRTAASWYNRMHKWDSVRWRKQWIDWSLLEPDRIYKLDELQNHTNKHDDSYGLHQAINDGDMDYYYSIIPKADIEFAEEMSDGR
jgi:hypothetical protein